VRPREVRQFVRDDCPQLVSGEQSEVGDAEHQVVARPEQARERRYLADRGVQVIVDQERVHLRAPDDRPDVLDQLEQRRCFGTIERQSLRRVDLHVQRAADHHEQHAEGDQELKEQNSVAEPGE
jgi:hypothetical protein